ncbi:unnamed protein product [Peniophora sp. CBMAI 1063]|nr:unnamed protein product [Peniophora sp. CBMAI 1063]
MSSSAHDLRQRRAASPVTTNTDFSTDTFDSDADDGGSHAETVEPAFGITPYRLVGALISLSIGVAKVIAAVLTHSFDVVDVVIMLLAPAVLYVLEYAKSSVKAPGPIWWFFHHEIGFRRVSRQQVSRNKQQTALPPSPVKVVYENGYDQHVASYSAMLHNYLQRDQRTSAPEIVYVDEMSGEPHEPTWSATCTVAQLDVAGKGSGKTKTQARHMAARSVLVKLGVLSASST